MVIKFTDFIFKRRLFPVGYFDFKGLDCLTIHCCRCCRCCCCCSSRSSCCCCRCWCSSHRGWSSGRCCRCLLVACFGYLFSNLSSLELLSLQSRFGFKIFKHCRPLHLVKSLIYAYWIPRVRNHLYLWFTISFFDYWSHRAVNWNSKHHVAELTE